MNNLCVLQLDTKFPRLPGDVACRETFTENIRLVRIKNAYVKNIVSSRPENRQFFKFKAEVCIAKEKIITTSCGFTYYWQNTLNSLTQSEVITSALCCLNEQRKIFDDNQILILTFDEKRIRTLINSRSVTPFKGHIGGLTNNDELYKAIINDSDYFSFQLVQKEMSKMLETYLKEKDIKLLILECTNMVPFKKAFKDFFEGKIIDILTLINEKMPGCVRPNFL